jgi:ABC-type anion transport system duplicated permease subunit
VDKLKEKLLLVSVVMILIALAAAPLASAAPAIYGYMDKTQYKPGETVKMSFWIHNPSAETIELKNITIRYPWYSPFWDSNQTIKYETTTTLVQGQNRSEVITFPIPNDGRAEAGDVMITITYKDGTGNIRSTLSSVYLSVISYGPLENMDKIVTLLTVLVVLVIVGAVIIAATIFLAVHKPQVTWKAEQKTE